MVDALISFVLEEFATVIKERIAANINIVASVEDDIERLKTTFKIIQVVLKDAERRKAKDELVRIWLDELTIVAKDMKCVLSEWSNEIQRLQQINNGIDHHDQSANNKMMKRVRNFPYFCFVCFGFRKAAKRLDIGTKIKDIRERLDFIASEKDKYRLIESKTNDEVPQRVITSSMVDVFEVCGRHGEKEIIVNKLLSIDHYEKLVTRISSLYLPDVISIVGMEGLGKTTLAQLVFNDEAVQAHFEMTVWICVSSFFNLIKVAKAILEEVGLNIPNSVTWNALQRLLRDTFKGKRFLLVFDDVCSDDRAKWEPLMLPLKYGAQESRILITTRNQKVAVIMNSTYIHSLKKLSDDECRLLIYRMSTLGKKEDDQIELLKEISTEIAKKCNGLPLVALTIGRHLRFNDRHEWQRVLECDIWELEEIDIKDLD